MAGVANRQVKLSRGRFLGGSSGCNGTLCIRGNKQDYDDWGLDGWSGEDFFKYMRKVISNLCEIHRSSFLTNYNRRKHSIPSLGFTPIRPAMATPDPYILSLTI
jgi:choline dehydrogenase-like flavoprotein